MRSLALLLGAASALALGCSSHHASHPHPDGDMSATRTDMAVGPLMYDLACAGTSAKAELKAVTLLFLLDASESMADTYGTPPVSKYASVQGGLEAFFADPESAGLSAAMTIFPYTVNPQDQCNLSAYDPGAPGATGVPLTALPAPSPFAALIEANTPGTGSTPTLPAVQGMIAYGQTLLQQQKQVALVLVTDGVPDTCGSDRDVAQALGMVNTTLPTYVVGVGTEMALDTIAQGGGQPSPIPVTVGDPVKTKSDLLTALEQIRGLVLSCNFPIPAPPNHQTINFDQVNVTFTPSGAATEDLLYDPMCTGSYGWYYDDPNAPKQVLLCPSICNTVRQDHGGAIDVVYGCGTFMQVT